MESVSRSSGVDSPAPVRRAALVFVFITVLLDMLALGMVVPVLPKLVETFMGGDTANAARIYGIFGTAWALMQFVFSPLLGALSDRFGRRPVILISIFGLGFDYLLMAVAPTLGWLFVGRVISGITAATFSTAGAYIADVTPPERRAGGFGLLGAAFGIGFVLGPAFGGVLGAVDPRLPFWIAAGLSLTNAMYGLFVLPESLPPERRAPFDWRRGNPIGSLGLLRSRPGLAALAGVNFFGYLAHESLPSTFVLYAGYRWGWDERAMGLFLAGVGICAMVVQGILVQRAVTHLGERAVLLGGLLLGALGFGIYASASNGAAAWAGVPLQALWGLASPTALGMMTRRVNETEQGRLQGANASMRGISGLIGPSLFTLTFAHFIGTEHLLPGAPFFLAAAMLVAALALGARATQRE